MRRHTTSLKKSGVFENRFKTKLNQNQNKIDTDDAAAGPAASAAATVETIIKTVVKTRPAAEEAVPAAADVC